MLGEANLRILIVGDSNTYYHSLSSLASICYLHYVLTEALWFARIFVRNVPNDGVRNRNNIPLPNVVNERFITGAFLASRCGGGYQDANHHSKDDHIRLKRNGCSTVCKTGFQVELLT